MNNPLNHFTIHKELDSSSSKYVVYLHQNDELISYSAADSTKDPLFPSTIAESTIVPIVIKSKEAGYLLEYHTPLFGIGCSVRIYTAYGFSSGINMQISLDHTGFIKGKMDCRLLNEKGNSIVTQSNNEFADGGIAYSKENKAFTPTVHNPNINLGNISVANLYSIEEKYIQMSFSSLCEVPIIYKKLDGSYIGLVFGVQYRGRAILIEDKDSATPDNNPRVSGSIIFYSHWTMGMSL